MYKRQHGAASGLFQWTNLPALKDVPTNELRKISNRIRTDARAQAPVDTGRLRDSLHVRSERSRGGGVSFTIITYVPYAAYQEFGTSRIPAQAFMGKALAKARARYGR